MSAKVIAGYLQGEELQKAFKHFVRPQVCLILETLTDLKTQLIEAKEEVESQAVNATDYEKGRMFDSEFELRWQRMRGYPKHIPPYRVVLICDEDSLLAGFDFGQMQSSSGKAAKVLTLTQSGGDAFYLWGEAVADAKGEPTGEWYEKEVPRIFDYPVDYDKDTRRVRLETKTYRLSQEDAQESDLNAYYGEEFRVLHRFVAMIATEE